MTCREFAEFILDYVEGRLPPEITAAFEKHLALCPHCVAYLENYLATLSLEKNAFQEPEADVPPEVPRELVQAIMSAIRSQ